MRSKKHMKTFILITLYSLFAFSAFAQTSAGGAIMAIDERALAGGGSAEASSSDAIGSGQTKQSRKKNSSGKKQSASSKSVQTVSANKIENTYKKPVPKSAPPKKYDGFVIGDKYTFFNFEIVKYVQPVHTIKAQEAGAKGLVQVEILIGENGNVLQAKARSGNKLLHPEAEKAALMTKFNKPSVYGKPARAFGFIVFRFGLPED